MPVVRTCKLTVSEDRFRLGRVMLHNLREARELASMHVGWSRSDIAQAWGAERAEMPRVVGGQELQFSALLRSGITVATQTIERVAQQFCHTVCSPAVRIRGVAAFRRSCLSFLCVARATRSSATC